MKGRATSLWKSLSVNIKYFSYEDATQPNQCHGDHEVTTNERQQGVINQSESSAQCRNKMVSTEMAAVDDKMNNVLVLYLGLSAVSLCNLGLL